MAMTELLIGVISLIITVPLSALLLMLSTKIFKLEDSSYKTAFLVAVIVGLIGFAFGQVLNAIVPINLLIVASLLQVVLVSILLAILLIKKYYKIDWGKTLLVWLVWFVLSRLILGFIIGLIIVAIMMAVGLSAI